MKPLAAEQPIAKEAAPELPREEVPVEPSQTAAVRWPLAILDRTNGEFAVARELARARRERRQLSVVLFDISAAAHQEPERIPQPGQDHLQAAAETLLRAIRESDLPIRWSGNELLVVLPSLGGAEARPVAERVRAALQAGSHHRLAISGGVAELQAEETFGAVVARAREKVQQALERGNNRVA
jgi:diguanylate cyclase (GGDEF)-like protein